VIQRVLYFQDFRQCPNYQVLQLGLLILALRWRLGFLLLQLDRLVQLLRQDQLLQKSHWLRSILLLRYFHLNRADLLDPWNLELQWLQVFQGFQVFHCCRSYLLAQGVQMLLDCPQVLDFPPVR